MAVVRALLLPLRLCCGFRGCSFDVPGTGELRVPTLSNGRPDGVPGAAAGRPSRA